MCCACAKVAPVCGLALLLSLGAVRPSTSSPASVLDVIVSGGEVTVDVRGVSLAQVLQAVGQRAGVELTLRGDLSAPITQSFSGVPLEEAFQRLAAGHSVVVTYAVAPGDSSRRGRLTEVWVLGRSTATDISVAVGGMPGTTSVASTQRNRGEPRLSSRRDQEAEDRAPVATLHFPLGGWLSGIQALADEANRGGEGAVARLTDISASEPDALVRQQAVAALGRLQGRDVEPVLTAALADDDASVRMQAVRGLRGTGTETAVQALAGALRGDADPSVRLAALDALMSFPGRAMLQGLVNAAADPDARVRDAAARGLAWWNARPSGAP
jgi:hypothetical protein